MFYRIVVWKNLNKNKYYYKKLTGYICRYYVGYINQYNHEVVLIIEISEFLEEKKTIKEWVINRIKI